jgi:hypothetical protein
VLVLAAALHLHASCVYTFVYVYACEVALQVRNFLGLANTYTVHWSTRNVITLMTLMSV